jgi:hypothetical protein
MKKGQIVLSKEANKSQQSVVWFLDMIGYDFPNSTSAQNSKPLLIKGSHRNKSDFVLGKAYTIPVSSINCSKNFFIASAYFTLEHDAVRVEISSAHRAWLSDTPYVQPVCRIQNMSRSLITKKHYSYCLPFPLFPDMHDELKITIEDQGAVQCSFPVHRLIRTPSRFTLMAMTVVRNPLNLREWIQYHLGQGFQHLVIYDDSSTMVHVSSLVSDFVSSRNVTVVDWSHAGFHRSRQFTAMQDFALRFAAASEWVVNFDDDCFFSKTGPKNTTLKHLLDSSLREGFAQVRVAGAWYGACVSKEVAGKLKLRVDKCFYATTSRMMLCPVLDARGCPQHALFSGRVNSIGGHAFVPAIHPKRKFQTTFSFVHTGEPFMASETAHGWDQLSPTGKLKQLDPRVYHYRHLKVLDYARHIRKATNSSWDMLKGQSSKQHWLRVNRDLCKVHAPAWDAQELLGKC